MKKKLKMRKQEKPVGGRNNEAIDNGAANDYDFSDASIFVDDAGNRPHGDGLPHHMDRDHNWLYGSLFVTCHRMLQGGVRHNRLWYFYRLWSPKNLKSLKS